MEIRLVRKATPLVHSSTRTDTIYNEKKRDVTGLSPVGPWDYPNGSQAYKLEPVIGSDNPNVTCGRNAFDAAPRTETADILAGSEVGFRVSSDGNGNLHGPGREFYRPPNFWHAGPGMIYLSRAPNDDLLNYKGDGDWFKIAYAGPVDDTHWSLWPSVGDVCQPLSFSAPYLGNYLKPRGIL